MKNGRQFVYLTDVVLGATGPSWFPVVSSDDTETNHHLLLILYPTKMDASKVLLTTHISLCFSSSTVTSQRPSSHGSSTSTGLHLALSTTTTMSHPMTPTFGHAHHGSLFPHFPSFHPHPGALGYPHGPAGESPFPYPSNAPGFRHELHITARHPP